MRTAISTRPMRLIFSALVLSALVAGPAAAQDTAELDAVLLEIDTVPTAAQLEARWPDALDMMIEVANDATRVGYARERAITLLSVFDEPEAREALEALCGDANPDVRRLAVYTLGRGFGLGADAQLVVDVAALLTDVDADVQAYAVRALRWIDHPNARAVLEDVAANNADLSAVATHVLSRRAALFPDEASSHSPLAD